MLISSQPRATATATPPVFLQSLLFISLMPSPSLSDQKLLTPCSDQLVHCLMLKGYPQEKMTTLLKKERGY